VSDSDPNPDEQYCPSCGETIPKESTFCPECGVNVSDPESKSKEGLFSVLSIDKTEASVIVFSLFVFLGAFLNWGTNSVVTVTGLDVGYGYFTIILSFITVLFAQTKGNKQKRMIMILLMGIIMAVIAILFYARLSQIDLTRGGGGLLLTLFSGSAIFISGYVGFAIEASSNKAAIVTMALILVIAGGPILIHYYNVSQLEVRGASITTLNDDSVSTSLSFNNPSDHTVYATFQFEYTIYGNNKSDSTTYVRNVDADVYKEFDRFSVGFDGMDFNETESYTCEDLPCEFDNFTFDVKIKPFPIDYILTIR
jgi:hypothetical protein